jgi:hypothetical protein
MPRISTRLDLELGALPVEAVNRALGLELEPGPVVITVAAQVHVARRRPEEYARLLPHLATAVATPLYIGDDHRNPGKIELVARVRATEAYLLVAIVVARDASGRYRVASFYPIKPEQVQNRRARGFLKTAAYL